nr:unnamed protein product [Spirometra erinaceieuropaei]
MEFLEQGHLISDLQHGFRQNRSCLSSLLLSTEQWTRALDEDGRVDVIYTDFKKAFDSIPHKRLIYKLSEIGIRGRLLTWITEFLNGRSQTVCIEASRSTPTPVLSGVPQGSVLGPLLFLVYINDCVDDLGCSAIMFADDVKLWRSIRSDADRSADGKVEIDDQVKASLLSDFFQSVFTREPNAIFAHPSIRQTTSPPSTLPHPIPSLPSLTEEPLFSSTIVRAELLRLKSAKSPGPDRIPALALRELANELYNPRSNRPERRTALVARELARYKVDIAALSETRFSKQGQLEKVGAGYTFFLSGRPRAERRDAGVAFAIQNDIDWFDDNDAATRNLLAEKNRLHKAYVDHPTDDNKAAFYRSRRQLQQRLREMQDAWTARKAEEIQGYADGNDWKNFFSAIKAVYCPPTKGTAPLLSADGSTLLTEKTQILQRRAEHFRGVLKRPSAISDAAIARLPQVETNADLDLPPSLQETIRAV